MIIPDNELIEKDKDGNLFITNEDGITIGSAYHKIFNLMQNNKEKPLTISLTSGYFSLSGWGTIKGMLSQANKIQLLIGTTLEGNKPNKDRSLDSELIKNRSIEMIEATRNNLSFSYTKTELDNIKHMISMIKEEKLEIRLYTDSFLHAKTLHLSSDTEPLFLAVGSANLTYSGLNSNSEAVVGVTQPELLSTSQDWFKRAWEKGEDYSYKIAEMYESLTTLHDSNLVYYRMLYELYGANLGDNHSTSKIDDIGPLENLYPHQRDGFYRVISLLDRYNGCLIADDVGLGKTYVGGALLKYYASQGKKSLVVCPAFIKEATWMPFLNDKENKDLIDDKMVEVYSYEGLKSNLDILSKGSGKYREVSHYGLILVDEAHNFRNINGRSRVLNDLMNTFGSDLVLMSATPINNSLIDLYNILSFFLPDNALLEEGYPSISRKFTEMSKSLGKDVSWEDIWNILDKVILRRDRAYLKEFYGGNSLKVIEGSSLPNLIFPNLLPPIVARYESSFETREIIESITSSLEDEVSLRLTTYRMGSYFRDNDNPKMARSHLMIITLLKRLESSPTAFLMTCQQILKKTQTSIERLGNDNLRIYMKEGRHTVFFEDEFTHAVGEDLDLFEDSILEDDIEDSSAEEMEINQEEAKTYFIGKDYPNLLGDLKLDEIYLQKMIELIAPMSAPSFRNTKIVKLISILDEIAIESMAESQDSIAREDGKKVLIFTSSAVTAQWLYDVLTHEKFKIFQDSETLQECYVKPWVTSRKKQDEYFRQNSIIDNQAKEDHRKKNGSIKLIIGSSRPNDKMNAVKSFSPKFYKEEPKLDRNDKGSELSSCDILIGTDVLAEGVNLQQARRVIHFDLPWNPMVMVQRVGRIDRIGSQHQNISNYCLYPEEEILDRYLRLAKILAEKMEISMGVLGQSDITGFAKDKMVGKSNYLPECDTIREIGLGKLDPFSQVGKEHTTRAIILREELKEFLADPDREERVKRLPKGSGCVFYGLDDMDKWIFCFSITDNESNDSPTIRFVSLEKGKYENNFRLDTSSFLALNHAKPREPLDKRVISSRILEIDFFNVYDEAIKFCKDNWNDAIEKEKKNKTINNREKERDLREKIKLSEQIKTPEDVDKIIRYCREATLTDWQTRDLKKQIKAGEYTSILLSANKIRSVDTGKREINEDNISLIVWSRVMPSFTASPSTVAKREEEKNTKEFKASLLKLKQHFESV